jgi:predicted HicB family RNase H-like nuclease
MHTESEILAACKTHGTKTVYDAAMARLSGDHQKLAGVDLTAPDLAEANRIGSMAFLMLSDTEQRADFVAVSAAAKRMGRPPKPAGEVKAVQLQVRTTQAVVEHAQRLADAAGMSRNAWIEALIIKAKL